MGDAQYSIVKDIHEMLDGKLLISGSMLNYYYLHNDGSSTPFNTILKLHHDGSLDSSFKFNGSITLSGRYSHLSPLIKKIHVENDGKIVLFGAFEGVKNSPAENYHGIIRLTPNGEVDKTFPKLGGILNTSTVLMGENRFIGSMQNPEHRLGQAVSAFFVTDVNWNINEELSNGISGLKRGNTYAMEIDEDGNLVMAGVFNIMHDEGFYKSLIRIIPE